MICYINRGLPGSGKSTRAKLIAQDAYKSGADVVICSTDDYFVCPCCQAYNFYLDRLGAAHRWCQAKALNAFADKVDVVIIDNTNCTARECRPYVEAALQQDYAIVFLEPETPWAFDLDQLEKLNTHNVPREALERMLRRWVPDMTVALATATVVAPGEPTKDEAAAAASYQI